MECASLFDTQWEDDISHATRLIVAHQETHGAVAARDFKRAFELKAQFFDMRHLAWLELSSGAFVQAAYGLAGRVNRFGHEADIHCACGFIEDTGIAWQRNNEIHFLLSA